jgi:plasmid stabilization system protein ParE
MATKHRYSPKEHRQVEHIKDSEVARGVPADEAEGIGYATVNKLNPDEHRYSEKEDRQAEHIIESEEARGKSEAEAKRIAYATVNKLSSSKPSRRKA